MNNSNFAGFWIRVAATIIDQIWISIIAIIPIILNSVFDFLDTEGVPYFYFFIVSIFVIPAVICISMWQMFQSTPGKMLLGLKILDAKTLEPATQKKYILRYLGYFISMPPIYLGCIWAGIDKNKQAVHDHIAGTVVIYKK